MKDVVSSFAATALIQLANIGSGILLARMLQPEGRGELAAVMLWPAIVAALGIWGLHEAVAYHAARRRHAPGRILRTALLLAAAGAALLLLVGAAAVELVFAGRDAEVRAAALLYLSFIPLNLLSLVLVGMFQGRQRFGEWNLLRCSVHVFYLALIPLFALAGLASVWGFAAASLLANALTLFAAAALAWRAGWFAVAEPAAGPAPVAGDLLRYGGSVHLGAAVAIVAERLDQLIVSVALSAADLGLYVVALTMARLPFVAASTLATVAFPKIAAAEPGPAKFAVFAKYSRAAVVLVVPTACAVGVAAPWLLRLLFGESFAAAAGIVWILAAGAVPLSLKAMLSAGLKAHDRGLAVGKAEAVCLALSAGGLLVLLPLAGLAGAAAASSLAQAGTLLFLAWRIRKELGAPLAALFVPTLDDLRFAGRVLRAGPRRAA